MTRSTIPVAPGYSYWLPIPRGPVRDAIRSPLNFQLRLRERFGDVARIQLGPFTTHFLFHPDHVSRVLREQQKRYVRGWHYRLLRKLFGENLVASDGEFWRLQRRLAQPAFSHQRLSAYGEIMVDSTVQMVDRWTASLAVDAGLDVVPNLSRLALAIAGRTLFSQDVSGEADVIGTSFGEVSRYLEYRFSYPVTSAPAFLPTARNRRFRRARTRLYDVVLSMILQRRQESRDYGDLLSMLMRAQDEETGQRMTDEQLCIEALTFLIAGHETTAKGLAWTFYLLASHRQVREEIHSELESALGSNTPAAAAVPGLKVIQAVVKESLRLYPPVWTVARQAVTDDEIGGYHIPARSTIILSPYVTHRHPGCWERPDEFDPNRFSAEETASRSKGAYFPFLTGPHQCIGNEFAMLEMCLIVAIVLQSFDFDLHPGQDIQPIAGLTLNPSGPIRIRLSRRH